jgi:hypothetical protein
MNFKWIAKKEPDCVKEMLLPFVINQSWWWVESQLFLAASSLPSPARVSDKSDATIVCAPAAPRSRRLVSSRLLD